MSITNILEEYHSIPPNDTKVTFDLSQCVFVSPPILVLCNVLALKLRQRDVDVDYQANPSISNYLQTIKFPFGFDPCHKTQEETQRFFDGFSKKNYMPLTCFPITALRYGNVPITLRDRILQCFNDQIYKQLQADANSKQIIGYLIGELCTNMVEHSQSSYGILMSQAYQSKGILEMSFADFGIGLNQSYQSSPTHFPKPKNDNEAINFAIDGKSTKGGGERGFGIRTSKDLLVNGLSGSFFMMSGHAFNYHSEIRNDLTSFPGKYDGCFLSLQMKINSLGSTDLYSFV